MNLRHDIQFLRGVAVSLVVVYHANIGLFTQGFLGVDIFFVVSGYLITKLLIESHDAGELSLVNFYLRRARRLLPALYCTLLITSLFASVLLTPKELSQFAPQLVGALTFSSNLVLPTQLGYFAPSADNSLLLHIWSLSLEEQYYFLLPIFLMLVPHRWRLFSLLTAAAFSLWMCIAWSSTSGAPPFFWRLGGATIQEWAFFLFPTRAWELLAGSICAYLTVSGRVIEIPKAIKWTSLLTVLVVAIFQFDPVHPRLDAIIAVLATSSLVLGSDTWLPRNVFTRCIGRVGDWSYSVYLVHWPIFVFFHIVYSGDLPGAFSVALIAASILLGWLQFRYIETPVRRARLTSAALTVRAIAGASACMGVLAFTISASTSAPDGMTADPINIKRQVNYGLSESCEGSIGPQGVHKNCILNDRPMFAVWGDSYAMHLLPGLVVSNQSIVQLTKSVCGPFNDLAPINGRYNVDWARACQQHNTYAFDFLTTTNSVSHVVLSANFENYFSEDKKRRFLLNDESVFGDSELAIVRLRATIKSLESLGKHVLVVSPLPKTGMNVGNCLERVDRGLPSLRKCTFKRSDYLVHDGSVIDALERATAGTSAPIFWLADLLCDSERCNTRLGDKYIYRDTGHLSVEGSIALLESIDLRLLF